MSNQSDLSADAAELLGKSPEPAVGEPEKTQEELRAERDRKIDETQEQMALGQDRDGNPRFVPISAFLGLRDTEKQLRAALGEVGYEMVDGKPVPIGADGQTETPESLSPGGQGIPLPPQLPVNYVPQPAAPMQAPQLVELAGMIAEATGGDQREIAQKLAGTVMEVMGPLAQHVLAPLTENAVQASKQQLAAVDPDFPLYEKSYDYYLNDIGGPYRATPQASDLARRLAIADHLDDLTERRITRKSGKVVGRFVESAAPGSEPGAAPVADPVTAAWARSQGFSPDEIATAAEIKARREGRK